MLTNMLRASQAIQDLDACLAAAILTRDTLRARVCSHIQEGKAAYILEWDGLNLVRAEASAETIQWAADWLSGRDASAPSSFRSRLLVLKARAERVQEASVAFAMYGGRCSTSQMVVCIDIARRAAYAQCWFDPSSRLFRILSLVEDGIIIDDVTINSETT